MKKYKDIIAGGVLFAVGFIYFCMSFSIKLTYIDRVVGSRVFPQICGAALMALSLAVLISGVLSLHRSHQEETPPDGEELAGSMPKQEEKQLLSPAMKTFLVLVSFALFCGLLDKIGFGPAAFLYLFSQMLLISGKKLTKRAVVFYLLLSLALAAGIYYLFYKGFSLMLPKASWF